MSSTEKQTKICCWCKANTSLVENKKFSQLCKDRAYSICKRCKFPFDNESYFQLDQDRCNSCQKKYIKEKEKRSAVKASLSKIATPKTIKNKKQVTSKKILLTIQLPGTIEQYE